jgi:hypothetical protein
VESRDRHAVRTMIAASPTPAGWLGAEHEPKRREVYETEVNAVIDSLYSNWGESDQRVVRGSKDLQVIPAEDAVSGPTSVPGWLRTRNHRLVRRRLLSFGSISLRFWEFTTIIRAKDESLAFHLYAY